MPFISLLDDRAKPKGSRDPLGFELIWSHFGRKVVGNLTTITSSMDNFAVALLGFYWVNQLIPNDDSESRHKKVREAFLLYEQLIGYMRYYSLNKASNDIMGITRIKKRIEDDSFKITLGLQAEQQILSDQASYGLWGLYSTAARESGLVQGADRIVTAKGAEIALSIIDQLGDSAKIIQRMIQMGKKVDKAKLQTLASSFMSAIHHESVQVPLLDALMTGEDKPLQKELWAITQSILTKPGVNKDMKVWDYIDEILSSNPGHALTQCMQDIVDVERLLVASNNLFHYCRGKNNESLKSVVSIIKHNYSYLPDTLPDDESLNKSKLPVILKAFKEQNISNVITELLILNKNVMKQRNGAPWLELSSGGFEVKVKNDRSDLKGQQKLESHWDYDYFLGSYLNIASKHIGN